MCRHVHVDVMSLDTSRLTRNLRIDSSLEWFRGAIDSTVIMQCMTTVSYCYDVEAVSLAGCQQRLSSQSICAMTHMKVITFNLVYRPLVRQPQFGSADFQTHLCLFPVSRLGLVAMSTVNIVCP